jgi:ribonuclease Y
MGLGESAIVIVLLVACLIALLLVRLARREADAQRQQAFSDVAHIKEEAKELLSDAHRREERLTDREREVATEQRSVVELSRALTEREEAVAAAEARSREAQVRADAAVIAQLEDASGLSASQARAELAQKMTDLASHDAAAKIRRIEADAGVRAADGARWVIATAVQRLAVPTSSQAVVTLLTLPSEEMKGRIIGKEGRNIRTFEALTGVNVIIDDTPDTVVLSCFDPERREIATVALEALMADGRINPPRIETAYTEAAAGSISRAVVAGHAAAERAGVAGLHPELVELIGRLRLRTSYGQNVLEHLVETAQIAASIAAELGADVDRSRRAAFLHDLGKAFTAEQGGTHAAVGARVAQRCGEDPVVVNAIAAHHDEVPAESVEAVIVQAADACSAARPGARREELDQYIERMDKLESLVAEHAGVRRVLAMAAGREVRVVVEPDEIDDAGTRELARTIAKHIEADLSYPGEIKVTVIRELRADATAG